MSKNLKKVFLALFMLFTLFVVIVPKTVVSATAPPNINLNKRNLTLEVGQTSTLSARVNPASRKNSLKWKTSNKSIVTVTKGKLKARKAGNATVTAYIANRKATCKVKVKAIPKYTVTFKNQKTVIGRVKVQRGKNAPIPKTIPRRTGYTFNGWDKSTKNIRKNTTINARWKINTYSVVFRSGSDIYKRQTVQHGKSATAPAPTRAGYTFDGWDIAFNNVRSNITVNAKWKLNIYTVTFRDGETILKTQTVQYGQSASAPDAPTKTGHTFDGWDIIFINVIDNLTVNAKWSINTFTVTFRDGTTTLKTQTVEYGQAATAPDTPTKEGSIFIGWDRGFGNVTSNITVNAQWIVDPETLEPTNTITVWGNSGDQTLLSAAATFEDKYPGVKIAIIQPPGGDLHDAFLRAMAAGSAPDTLKLDHIYLTGMGERGLLTNLNDLEFFDLENTKNRFIDSCWDAVTLNNNVYGLPHESNTIAMTYNPSLLQAWTGSPQAPVSYEQMLEMGRSAKPKLNSNQYFFTLPFFDDHIIEGRASWATLNYLVWLWGHGGEVFNETNTQATFNSEEGVESLRKILELTNTEGLVDRQYRESAFYNGQIGLLKMGAWNMPNLKSNSLDVAMLPTLSEGKPAYSGLGLSAYGLVVTRPNKANTYKFIEMLCNDTTMQQKYARMANQLPVTKAAIDDSFYESDPMWKTFVAQHALSKSRPGVRNWGEIQRTIADCVKNAILNNQDPKTALDNAATIVNNLLN